MTKQFINYGKSMYGGWYVNWHDENGYNGIRKDTLKELCEAIGISKEDIKKLDRFDN